jgi:hypothetical protein
MLSLPPGRKQQVTGFGLRRISSEEIIGIFKDILMKTIHPWKIFS